MLHLLGRVSVVERVEHRLQYQVVRIERIYGLMIEFSGLEGHDGSWLEERSGLQKLTCGGDFGKELVSLPEHIAVEKVREASSVEQERNDTAEERLVLSSVVLNVDLVDGSELIKALDVTFYFLVHRFSAVSDQFKLQNYMDNEAIQLKCKIHPTRPVTFVYIKQACPYASRLACSKCIMDYNSFDGFVDLIDALNDPSCMLNRKDTPYGIYDCLNDYFQLLKQDPEVLIKQFADALEQQIRALMQSLQQGIAGFRLFQDEIKLAKKQFVEVQSTPMQAIGHPQLKRAFEDVQKVENYHSSEEWKVLEARIEEFALQFETQQNQELNETFYRIKQKEENFFDHNTINTFNVKAQQTISQLSNQLAQLGIFKKYTTLCDTLYFYELVNRVRNANLAKPKIELIFKGSEDGMNANRFWAKCVGKGPTLIICKSEAGHVFGGYTPCKWVWNGAWQTDEQGKSFLFSYTRKEIYPVIQKEHAIFSRNDYGPTFGGQHNLYIAADFKNGYSNLTNQYYSNENYTIENPKTHLMGGERPDLVEMEVFLIE